MNNSLKQHTIGTFAALAFIAAGSMAIAQNVHPDATKTKSSDALRQIFRDASAKADASTISLRAPLDDGRVSQVALATVITSDGYVLTKASEVLGRAKVTAIIDRHAYPAKVVGVSEPLDLAMMKISLDERDGKHVEASTQPTTQEAAIKTPVLIPITWADTSTIKNIPVGAWVITAGPASTYKDEPAAVGVVSVGRRKIPGRDGFLGVMLGDADAPAASVTTKGKVAAAPSTKPSDAPATGGATVMQVVPGSAAEKAGLKVNDVIVALNGSPVHNRIDLVRRVHNFREGDVVTFDVHRGSTTMQLDATLGANTEAAAETFSVEDIVSGQVSHRSSDFSVVLQHDTVIRPVDCGGPLTDLDGNVIGINIARAGRVETYALPADIVIPLLGPLQSGRLAPVNANAPTPMKSGETPTTLPTRGR